MRFPIALRTFLSAAGAVICLTFLSACQAPAARELAVPARRIPPEIRKPLPADGLIGAERAAMAVEDQQRAESALNIESHGAPRRDKPLRGRRRP